MTEHERFIHDTIEELCARLRYIAKSYPDVNLKECSIIGNSFDLGDHISNVTYIPCHTISGYHLANCDNYKACRDFEDGFHNKESKTWTH